MSKRIKELRKALNFTQEQLAQRLGIGKAALSMIENEKCALSLRNRNILIQELNVNPEFLDIGRGEIFSVTPDMNPHLQHKDGVVPMQSVPLYSIGGDVTFVSLFEDIVPHPPINYIHIPSLPKCDGALYIAGDSMYPLLKSGDIVLYKCLSGVGDIFWGDMYILSLDVAGDEYVTVKYIHQGDTADKVKLVSEREHHAPKIIDISSIRAIALVKASIRMNTMR